MERYYRGEENCSAGGKAFQAINLTQGVKGVRSRHVSWEGGLVDEEEIVRLLKVR